MEKYKVVILGAGISGMTAAIYLKRGGINPLIIESSVPGGVLNNIPSIENYPGYESISGPDLAMNIYKQVKRLRYKKILLKKR
ncbi:MAG: NAD(P)-binding protein [Bacilli bacterium]|nr:MAG: NAD(P)-binding protein [Bacilli bacterium]